MTTDRLECKFAEFEALPLTLEQSTAALPPPQHPAKVRATPGTFLRFFAHRSASPRGQENINKPRQA